MVCVRFNAIEFEFAIMEDAEAYDAWFRARVGKAMTSTAPGIPHDEVMAMAQAVIEKRRPR